MAKLEQDNNGQWRVRRQTRRRRLIEYSAKNTPTQIIWVIEELTPDNEWGYISDGQGQEYATEEEAVTAWDNPEPEELPTRGRWIVCTVCEGEGTTVNPDIDSNGLTHEDLEDDDFRENYMSGAFDITCKACNGKRVILPERLEELRQHAEDRKLAAREDGNFELYQGAGDYRYG